MRGAGINGLDDLKKIISNYFDNQVRHLKPWSQRSCDEYFKLFCDISHILTFRFNPSADRERKGVQLIQSALRMFLFLSPRKHKITCSGASGVAAAQ